MNDQQGSLFDLQEQAPAMSATEEDTKTQVFVGTSGYSFDDWKGTYYPADLPDREMLDYYARDFSTVEINASYYHLLPTKTYDSMLRRVPPGFSFAVKSYGGITHETHLDPIVATQYEESIRPLVESGRLKALLFQFPHSFRNTEEHHSVLARLSARFHQTPLVAEFRNIGWAVHDMERLLHSLNIAYCCVDEPPLEGLMPSFTLATRKDLGYVRFHGRNAEQWWDGGNLRYDYLYSKEELTDWSDKIQHLVNKTSRVFAFFNNCHLGQAVKNAKMLKDLLQERGMLVR